MAATFNAAAMADLIEVDLGPAARGYFTTRGRGAQMPSGPADNHPGLDSQADPYAGWNLAEHVGDDPARVAAHRRRLEELLGLGEGEVPSPEDAEDCSGPAGLAWMNQVHSAVVAPARAGETPTADALVLKAGRAGAPQGVCVLVADCVPLLLAAHDGSVVAAVHAGRKGMLDGVVPAALEALARAGVPGKALWAALGPSICGSCYEVPAQMQRMSAQSEPASISYTRWGTPGLDVAAGVLAQLERGGVTQIQVSGLCTMEDPRFFSYRRDVLTGRFAGLVLPSR